MKSSAGWRRSIRFIPVHPDARQAGGRPIILDLSEPLRRFAAMAHPLHDHSARALEHLERVRRICLALPEATEKTAWGAPTFRVKGKMFAMFFSNHHNDERIALWLHAPEGAQAILVAADPERIFVPPYQGPYGWIGLHVDLFDDEEIAAHASEAYCMVAPKKLQALLGGGLE